MNRASLSRRSGSGPAGTATRLLQALLLCGLLTGLLPLPAQGAQGEHVAVLKIHNRNTLVSQTPVLRSDGEPWSQVYVEIPAKLYMDHGWLRDDLSNLRFLSPSGEEITHWVPPTKDDNSRIGNLGVWLLIRDLPTAPSDPYEVRIVMGTSDSNANPRAEGDLTTDRNSASAASSLFPFYARDLSDDQLRRTPGRDWDDADTRFVATTLYSEDDYRSGGADIKTERNARTGNEFTLSVLNMKFYEHSQSEAIFYFLSQANGTPDPEALPESDGYRLYVRRAPDYDSVSDDLHYRRYHFILSLERREEPLSIWRTVAIADWYPYHNSRHLFEIKVGSERIWLRINGEDVPFQSFLSWQIDAQGRFIRPARDFEEGYFGLDRLHWRRSSGTDINHILLRRFFEYEPESQAYGNVDLVVGAGTPTVGTDVIELQPDMQQVTASVAGNTLDDYIFSRLNVARPDQVVDDLKVQFRNRGKSTDTFELEIVNRNPDSWLLYFCDEAGSNCSLYLPSLITLEGESSVIHTLRMIPSPSALFSGTQGEVEIRAVSLGDGSSDMARLSATTLTQLGCFWGYRAPQTILWEGGNGYNDLSDHQVLVTIDGETALDHARPDGSDIVFTDDRGSLLPFWIKKFDQANRHLEAWVRVPKIIGSGGDTVVYAWWGNPEARAPLSNKLATFDLWEEWGDSYEAGQPVGCPDGTTQCAGAPADPAGWVNVPTPDDFYNWWTIDRIDHPQTGQPILILRSDLGPAHKSEDTGPYLHRGLLGWDHYEVSYLIHAGVYRQYGGSANPQFNPVFYNDAGNMWGMEYFDNRFIFRPYASGIDYVWQYQTAASRILDISAFPQNDQWYWAKVRVFHNPDEDRTRLKLLMSAASPADVDDDGGFHELADFYAPSAFSLRYGEIGFGGWDGGFGFTDIRVRKYVEDAAGNEPLSVAQSAEALSPRGILKITRPQVTPPIFRGRTGYIESETTPFSWLGDVKVYYADCYINGECRTGENASERGTVSILGSLDADTPLGVGYFLMQRDPGEENGAAPGNRRILTSDGYGTLLDFDMARCSTLRDMLGTNGSCDADDGQFDPTERLIRYVRGYYVEPQRDGLYTRSLSRNFDGVPGYGDGDGVPDADEQWKIADLLHSNPLQVGIPNMGYADQDYWTDFVERYDDRDLVSYFMTNEGMLHAVRIAHWGTDAVTGLDTYIPDSQATELWAFIPNAVLPHLEKSTDATHEYLTDGLLRAIDIRMGGRWRTILFGLLGRGGLSFFAMDITDPDNPILLWENSGDHALIGTTISAPALGKLGDHWVAVLGSGWDTDYLANLESKNAWLTVIRLDTGEILKQIRVSDKIGNVLTDITALRNAADGSLSSIYFGDYFGAMWRLTGERLEALADGATLGRRDMLFVPDDYETTALPFDVERPVTVIPRVAKGPDEGEFWVYFGTGDYDEYRDSYPRQAFYALRDRTTPYEGDASLINMTDTSAGDNPAAESWMILLGYDDSADYILETTTGEHSSKGVNERVLKAAEVYGGFVFFTTFEPKDDPCGGGISRFYAINYLTGGVESDLFLEVSQGGQEISEVRSVELQASGIPSQPVILEGQDGRGSAIATGITSNTSGELEEVKLNPNKFSTALDILLWREKR